MDGSVVLEYRKVLDKTVKILSTSNNLLKSGDIIQIRITTIPYGDIVKPYIRAEVINRCLTESFSDIAWKFASCEGMSKADDFDNMDWRTELDDIRNLGKYNFFHLEGFRDFIESFDFEIVGKCR